MPLEAYLSDGSPAPRYSDGAYHLPEGSFTPPFRSEYDLHPATPWGKVKSWWQHTVLGVAPEPQPPSLYMTLIPLNDARLKPQRRWLLVPLMGTLLACAIAATFLCVPRGFSAGEIEIRSDRMSWNTTKGTYQLNLLARIPLNNPNYLQARVHGSLRAYFFDTEAGSREVAPTTLPARSFPEVLEVSLDASNLPNKYALTILSECNAFPKRLVFFLKGSLTVEDVLQRVTLSPIDTYFMIDCQNGGSVPSLPFPPGGGDDEGGERPCTPLAPCAAAAAAAAR